MSSVTQSISGTSSFLTGSSENFHWMSLSKTVVASNSNDYAMLFIHLQDPVRWGQVNFRKVLAFDISGKPLSKTGCIKCTHVTLLFSGLKSKQICSYSHIFVIVWLNHSVGSLDPTRASFTMRVSHFCSHSFLTAYGTLLVGSTSVWTAWQTFYIGSTVGSCLVQPFLEVLLVSYQQRRRTSPGKIKCRSKMRWTSKS